VTAILSSIGHEFFSALGVIALSLLLQLSAEVLFLGTKPNPKPNFIQTEI